MISAHNKSMTSESTLQKPSLQSVQVKAMRNDNSGDVYGGSKILPNKSTTTQGGNNRL